MSRVRIPRSLRCNLAAAALALLPLLSSLAGCSEKRVIPAVGPYSDVWLFTETGKQSPLLRDFVETLSHPITYVLEPENEFDIYLRDANQFAGNRDRKNLVMLTRTDKVGGLQSRISKFLGGDILARVKREGHLILYKRDLFARDQDVYIILMEGRAEEEYVLTRLAGTLRDRLRESTQERFRGYLLRDRENKGGGKYIWREYGFTLRFPPEYHLLQQKPGLGAIELHRKDPSRVIGLFWESGVEAAPTLADSLTLLAFRERIVDAIYDGDTVLPDMIRFDKAKLGKYDAIRMRGVWQNEVQFTGGPFVTYFLHDARRQRLVAVDLLIYAPGMSKHPFMRELEALASTFRY
jgi:hypothetical protein